MRRRGLVVGMAAGAAMSNRGDKQDDSAQAAQPAQPAQSDMATQLQELENLKQQGIITQEDFDAKKKQILGV
ncbi:hypothetical protein A3E49_03210 [Candidatus Saccharibacteria bacterium RIFCSPHIGHO2_12_FULL_49_19]|nr:MAG: hypothetical protein A3E49_03210 [Candidatus Saccharibacteria bacterium RIFCSPHIGHO2_12_FULL_49_19]